MTSRAMRKTIITNPLVPDQEAAAFLAADERWDGFAYYWRNLLPSNVYKVLEALMEHVRFNASTWQSGRPPIPSQERLALLSGISERTVCRILARDDQGRYVYTYRRCVYHRVTEASIAGYEAERARVAAADPHDKVWPDCLWRVGDLVAVKRDLADRLGLVTVELGDLIALFIKGVEHRWRYDDQTCRWLRTTNAYHVTPIMPLPPTLSAEIAYGLQLAGVRAQREKLTEEAEAVRAASDAPRSLNTPSCPPHCSAKLAEENPSVSLSNSQESTVSIAPGGESSVCAAPTTIESTDPSSDDPGCPETSNEFAHDPQIERDRDRSLPTNAASRSLDNMFDDTTTAACAPVTGLPAEAILSEGQVRLAQADAYAGATIEHIAQNMGDSKPSVARKEIIRALIKAGAPLEVMVSIAQLARNRITRFQELGGVVPSGKEGGYYLSTTRNTVKDVRKRQWAVACIDAEEAIKHAMQLQQSNPEASRIPPQHGETRSRHGTTTIRTERRIRQAPDGADHTAYTSRTRINF
jgi:hypothetical protein